MNATGRAGEKLHAELPEGGLRHGQRRRGAAEMKLLGRTDLGAIFVSLELSRSTWLVTSLSPGSGEKMSKHVVDGGNVAELLDRFEQLQQKARLRTGKSFPIVTIQEAGLDGFWIHRVLELTGPRVTLLTQLRSLPPVDVGVRRPTRSMERL